MENVSNMGNINIRVDNTLKKEASELFNDLGLNLSTAINIFLTQCVKEQAIPFEIKQPKPNRRLRKALKEAEKISKDPNRKGYTDIDKLFEDLSK